MAELHLMLGTLLVAGAAIHFAIKLRNPHRMGAADVAIWMTSLYFGIGPWAVFIAGGSLRSDSEFLPATFGAVALYMVGLGAAGQLANAIFKPRDIVPPGVRPVRMWTVIAGSTKATTPVVMCIFLAATAARLVVGIYFGNFFTGEGYASNMPEWLGDFLFVGEALRYGAFLWAAATFITTSRNRIPALFILVTDFFLMLTVGRRWLVIEGTMFLFVYVAFKGFRKSSILYAFGMVLVVYVAVSAFDRTRFYWLRHWENGSGISRFVSAFELGLSDPDPAGRALFQQGNYKGRPLDTENFCRLLLETEHAASASEKMNGRAVLGCLVHSIPYRIYAGKRDWPEPELNIKLFYGLNPKADMGSSFPAYGIADFGIPGALFIGVGLGLLFFAGELFARFLSPKFPYIAAGIAGVLLENACQVGNTPAALFTHLRNIGGLGLICALLMPFVQFSWRSEPNLHVLADEAENPPKEQESARPEATEAVGF